MPTRKSTRKRPASRGQQERKPEKDIHYVLESGSLRELVRRKEHFAELNKLYWDYYSELARQREAIRTEIHATLNETSISNFEFSGWQRAVKWKYSLHPLCTNGSLVMPGGRFNIGDVNSNVPSFPALYIAEDKDTALQETLGQTDCSKSGLSPQEIALTNPASESILSVSGKLERVFDLRPTRRLQKFVNLIKSFELSPQIQRRASKLSQHISVVTTASQLKATLLEPNWRQHPALFDVPANPQIFGQLVYLAGIDGILYPSKLTGKPCLTMFVENFKNTSSFVQLDDEAPDGRTPRKVSANNWRVCGLSASEVFALSELNQ
jgi:hypothetical protein